jgi:uncharacterized cupin superfamily protein
MRRLLFALLLFAAASAIPAPAQNGSWQNWCQAGNIPANVSGIASSNPLQGSFPLCQVEVFLTGTPTTATIYSNQSGTASLANPFCANADGSFLFWSSNAGHYDVTISNSPACNPAASGYAQLPAPFTWWDVPPASGGGGNIGTCTQFYITDWATASTLGCVGSAISGYFPIFQNAALPIAVAPSLIDSVASPVVTPLYTIQCDSATTIIDRAALLRFQSGASAVTIPLSTATGCGGLVTTAIDDGAGTLTFTATAPDTLSVYTGTTATDGTTSFTLTNGQYATLTQGFTGGWEARIVMGGGGGGTGAQYQSAYFNPANTIVGFGPGIAGTIHTSQGLAAAPAMLPPVLVDSTASPVTTSPYTIQCDSSSTIIDRVHTLRFRSGASAVTVPLSTATGCAGLVVSLLGDGAGTVTFTRTSPDTFSVFTGSTNTDGATTFTLTNGQHVTLAQGATGIWEVVMGGGGTGSAVVNVPFDSCVPAQTTNAGNSFLTVNPFTHADLGVWQFVLDTAADIFCYLRVPHNISGTAGTVIVDLASSDTTGGHTAVFSTADNISTVRNLNVTALTADATTCTYTTTTTAYANTECTFTVQSTLAADQFYVVDIHQAASASVTSNVQMPAPMLQITETF